MEISEDRLRTVQKSLSGPDQRLEPPLVVLLAVASLVADSEIQHATATKIEGRPLDEAPFTTWRYVALIPAGLVVLDATKPVADWEMGDIERPDQAAPKIDARFIPLSEVAYCKVVGIESLSAREWLATWEIGVRNQEPVHLPTGRSRSQRVAASAVGRAILDRLAAEVQ
ncbi:hypothetical protein [Kribbella sp. CA-294648]|uniref:hypothetical protein n=1 Tax=Kribbella sp. CA-294648 TaxID=3239948 RepID=UPI003D8E8EF3